jgi:hypothetical protein
MRAGAGDPDAPVGRTRGVLSARCLTGVAIPSVAVAAAAASLAIAQSWPCP